MIFICKALPGTDKIVKHSFSETCQQLLKPHALHIKPIPSKAAELKGVTESFFYEINILPISKDISSAQTEVHENILKQHLNS